MSRTLQSLGQLARQAVVAAEQQGGANAGKQLMQKRTFYPERYSPRQFSREKPVDTSALWWQKNAYIEALYKRRDTLEKEFSWTGRNTFELSYFIGGLTVLFYGLSLFGIRSADRQSNYPLRNFVGHPSPGQNLFVTPDEREFY